MSFLWATRGHEWGFRFVRDGGFPDPLLVHDVAFADDEEGPEVCRRIPARGGLPELVALRFPDPLGRKDRAGRVIPHFFVLLPPLADEVGSVEDGLEVVWPQVAAEYDGIWQLAKPPLSTD